MMTENQLAWLAGLLEGEGNFHIQCPRGVPGVVLRMGTTDRDIAERAHDLMGSKKVNTYKLHSGRKDYHCVAAYGANAVKLMTAVFPYMGERRKARITECLSVGCAT